MDDGTVRPASKNEKLISMKTFTFGENTREPTLSVNIPEVADPDYGMYTWPCAPVLAQYVWHHRQLMQGKMVLEIGSGTALCGVVAAKCGARVILSDSGLLPQCLANSRESAAANQLTGVTVIPLTWGLVTPHLLQLPSLDVILGSDCFYDTKDFEDVLVTVSFLLRRSPHCQFWCSYQNRSATRSIQFYLMKWGLTASEIPASSFCGKNDLANTDSVHLFIITLKTNDR
ncbi:hypothetical protein ACOMHN_024696 [Nucella lapillus]